jgi:hypothetical protein
MKNQLRIFREQMQGVALHLVEGRIVFEELLGAPRDMATSLLPQLHFRLADGLFLVTHDNLVPVQSA